MNQATQFLLHYGYWVLFAVVLAEQIGLPIPAVPILVAMGALAGDGHFLFLGAVLLAVAASLVGDAVWYHSTADAEANQLGLPNPKFIQ